jgi:putative oxidoreductase
MRFLRENEPHVYAALRIVAGFLFLWHGLQKLVGFPEPMPSGVPAFIVWIAGPIELVGGILVMLGLFTRPAAFLASGLMAFAYWMGHGGNPQHFTEHGWKALLPAVNGGDPAILYCFIFLYVAARGPGEWSVDATRGV